ncbi:MAG: acyltransferase [Melioribacteraceae bacterium]|nr:MAG: acyltransferase [Melioribacteraceae bacterium]
MKEKIVVIGGGGHAKVITSMIKRAGIFEPVGFTDPEEKPQLLGIPYLGTDDKLPELFACGVRHAVIGLGQIKSSRIRRKLVQMADDIGFELPEIIAPGAIINEEVSIGRGTVVMDGVVINSGTTIGEFSIFNTNASVDHDCEIGSFTHIAPGVTFSGSVIAGDDVLIGTGASVIQELTIVSGTILAAGSSLQRSVIKPGIFRGVPAKMIKPL